MVRPALLDAARQEGAGRLAFPMLRREQGQAFAQVGPVAIGEPRQLAQSAEDRDPGGVVAHELEGREAV